MTNAGIIIGVDLQAEDNFNGPGGMLGRSFDHWMRHIEKELEKDKPDHCKIASSFPELLENLFCLMRRDAPHLEHRDNECDCENDMKRTGWTWFLELEQRVENMLGKPEDAQEVDSCWMVRKFAQHQKRCSEVHFEDFLMTTYEVEKALQRCQKIDSLKVIGLMLQVFRRSQALDRLDASWRGDGRWFREFVKKVNAAIGLKYISQQDLEKWSPKQVKRYKKKLILTLKALKPLRSTPRRRQKMEKLWKAIQC